MNNPNTTTNRRIVMLDSLRGGSMVLVILYHLFYDLAFIYNVNLPSYLVPGNKIVELVHVCFLWVLFAVSGICSHYSKNLLRRGVLLYILGFAITLITSLFMPDQLIVFGVLSCFGASMVITALLAPMLDRIPWWLLSFLSILLWWIFRNFHQDGSMDFIITTVQPNFPQNEYLYPLGITTENFFSTDYFPIIPYIFMYFTGRGLFTVIKKGWLPDKLYRLKSGVLAFIGRHSLLIYIIHQPLLLWVLWLISLI